MPDSAVEPAPSAKSRARWKQLAIYAFVIVLMVWVGRRTVADAGRVDWSNVASDGWGLLAATVMWLAAFVFRSWLWGEMMRRVGYPVGHLDGARVFLASHLGRFLPGKLWSVVGAGIFAKQAGVPGAAAAVTMTVFLIIYYMVGSLAALLVIWRLSEAHLWSAVTIGVLGLGVLVFLGSRWFPVLLQWVGKKAKRNLTDLKLPSPAVLVMVAVGLAAVWALAGAALLVMADAIMPAGVTGLDMAEAIGSYSASLVAGFVVLFAPAGLGVRETVMLELLAPRHGAGYAGLIAIVSRIIITTLELALSLWGIWPHLMARRRSAAASKARRGAQN